MQQYQTLVRDILDNGTSEPSREGGSTISLFGYLARFNLKKGFPLTTGKPVPLRMMFAELVFFLNGQTNANDLNLLGGGGVWDQYAVQDDVLNTRKKAKYELALDLAAAKKITVPEAYDELIFADNTHPEGHPAGGYKLLQEHGIPLEETEVAIKAGELGPVYGAQWRSWRFLGTDGKHYKLDQLKHVIGQLKLNPKSRRHIVTSWNPQFLPNESVSPSDNAANGLQALPPCHLLFQFNVTNVEGSKPVLHLLMFQRSCDVMLGGSWNIASYSTITHLVANELGYDVGDFVWMIGNAHIYSSHIEGAKEYLKRPTHQLPELVLPEGTTVDNVTVDVLVNSVKNYKREAKISFELY